MNYQQALDYLDRFINYEKRPMIDYSAANYKLERVEQLLERLGNPHRAYPTVLIAGSKGKGSTAAMLASMLQAAGLKTGFYSKPHLHTFRERVRIDGELISEEELADLFGRVIKPAVDEIEAAGDVSMVPTYFELSAVLGFLYFAEQQVDIGVIEVGLGGRLDATNVVEPLVSVITPISLEHMAVLGDTLAKIAFEKAGIIKPGGLALIAEQPPEADEVFARVAAERSARLVRADEMAPLVSEQLFKRDGLPTGRGIVLNTPMGRQEATLRLLGQHQVSNAQTAICAFQLLLTLPDEGDRADRRVPAKLRVWDSEEARAVMGVGLLRTRWEGRLEIVARSPLVIVDGAHNGESAQRVREALEIDFALGGHSVVFVFGVNSDKDIEAIVRELAPLAAGVVLTPLHSTRSTLPEELAPRWEGYGVPVRLADSAAAAVEQASGWLSQLGAAMICATGSLYLVGEVREHFGLSLGHDR